jgi:hypothetical protein
MYNNQIKQGVKFMKVYCKKCNFKIWHKGTERCYLGKHKVVKYEESGLEPEELKIVFRSVNDRNRYNKCSDFEKRKFGKMTFIRLRYKQYTKPMRGGLV